MRHVNAYLLAAVVMTASCGSEDSAAGPPVLDEMIYDCTNRPDSAVTLATDESFVAIVNAEAAKGVVRDDAKAPALSAPSERRLSAGAPPRFEWRATTASEVPRDAVEPWRSGPRRSRRWAALLEWLTPISVAHAHCGAVTGENFLFRLEASGRPIYTAVLSVTAFTPDQSKWSKALEGRVGKPVTLTLMRAYLVEGAVLEGPYAGPPVAFTVDR